MLQGGPRLSAALLAIAAVVVIASSSLARDTPVGYVSIDCGGRPMLVAVDGRTAGRCPLDSIPLSPGGHVIQAWQSGGRKFTATPLTRRVEVVADRVTQIDFSSMRLVRVESEPFGAMISRDGAPLGSTPLAISVSPEDPAVLIEMEGFVPVTLSTQSLMGATSPIRLVLEPVPGTSATSRHKLSRPSGPEERGLSAYLTGIVCVGAITAAVVLKEQADSEFKDYLVTGDLREMDRHFRRAQQLDSWAIASWVVGEVALGLLVYDLLSHGDKGEPAEEESR